MSQGAILRCMSCGVTWLAPFTGETAPRESSCLVCGGQLARVEPDDPEPASVHAQPSETAIEHDYVGALIDVSQALGRGDHEAFLDLLDPEVDWHPSTIELFGDRAYRGREDVGRWLDFVERSWTGFHWDWTDVRVRDAKVAVFGTVTADARQRDAFRERVGWLWQMRERSVISMHGTTDVDRVLAELRGPLSA